MGKTRSKIIRPLAKGQITIPVEFRQELGIGADTLLNVVLEDGKLEIIPLRMGKEQILREYTDEDIQRFLDEDRINAETAAKVRRLLAQGVD